MITYDELLLGEKLSGRFRGLSFLAFEIFNIMPPLSNQPYS